jgi:hypothetical protein
LRSGQQLLASLLLLGVFVVATATGAGAAPSAGTAAASVRPAATPTAGPAVSNFHNSFHRNINSWCVPTFGFPPCDGASGDSGTIVRTKSRSSSAAYAPGIKAVKKGHWYATISGATDTSSGCPTASEDESCDGPNTDWGNPDGNYETFPAGGFTASLDIYLDTAWAAANPGNFFEWDTSVLQSNGDFGQDYIFTAETGTDGFTVGTGTNTRSSVPSPSVTIGTSGWYTFAAAFSVDPGSGDVEVTLSIASVPDNVMVPGASWVIPVMFNGDVEPPANVGGPLYGWFPNEDIAGLPIDVTSLQLG